MGRPSKQTREHLGAINRDLVQAIASGQELPSDAQLAQRYGMGERTLRTMRLGTLGLKRWDLRRWQQAASASPSQPVLLCHTPFAGLWLLVPQLLQAGLSTMAGKLHSVGRTPQQILQVLLTLIAGTVLGFQRLYHLESFRHPADAGLAFFTGRWRLWSDSSLWRCLHALSWASVQDFCRASLRTTVHRAASRGRISLDEHVVPSFTARKPSPLQKNRIPTRGRAYPAFRLYTGFDLDLGRFVGILVRRAQQALSQVLPDLLQEVRRVRQAQPVRLIFDRGGYKGSLFASLMADGQLSFIAMARATRLNVPQWKAIPSHAFQPYLPAGSEGKNLWIAKSQTRIGDCPQPLPSVVIRDDTPGSPQPWRVLFYKDAPGQDRPGAAIDEDYRLRQAQEMAFREFVHCLGGHCLPKAYQMIREPNAQGHKRRTVATQENPESRADLQLVAWTKCLTFNWIRDFGQAVGAKQGRWQTATLIRRYLARPGRLYLQDRTLIVQLDPFQGAEALKPYVQQVNQRQWTIPWLSGLVLKIVLADNVPGLADQPHRLKRLLFANSPPPDS